MISVVIPVGPNKEHQNWLDECIRSVAAQTRKPDEIVIVDDMANVDLRRIRLLYGDSSTEIKVWDAPWRMGVAHAFNVGVGLTDGKGPVLLLGADDTIDPECLQWCEAAFDASAFQFSTYWWLGVRYIDTGEEQFVPCGAGLVTRQLWERTGGFPVESAVGQSDRMFLSLLMHRPDAGRIEQVTDHKTLYNYRRHPFTDTAKQGRFGQAFDIILDVNARTWEQPAWNRYR